jgi:CBS domain-containing protein
VVGIGGLIEPHALGVGYDTIAGLLAGHIVPRALVGLIAVKGLIWAIALGSGTSGGVLAPLLMMGGALGALGATLLPAGTGVVWPLISMGAVLGGTMRSPFTAVIFALELTHDQEALLPLLIAAMTAHAFTVLVMKRSILTEKVARRGYHLTREYAVDPLEALAVRDVMSTNVATVPASMPVTLLLRDYFDRLQPRKHQGYPVVDASGALVGIVTRSRLLEPTVAESAGGLRVADIMERELITVYPEETCRSAAERMAQFGVGRLPVVMPEAPRRIAGIVTRSDLLKPRERSVQEERQRERFINLRKRSGRVLSSPEQATHR